MVGTGGLGFLMLDDEGNIKYAANAKDVCIPKSVGRDFTIYSVDADGSLHEVSKAAGGEETVELSAAGKLQQTLQNEQVIKLIVRGKIHGKDIRYLRDLISKHHLQSLDLEDAQIVTNNTYSYYQSYKTAANVMGDYAFQGLSKLISVNLPLTITKIGSNAFSKSGIRKIVIPDKVTSIGEDAFAYCDGLTTVLIGKSVNTLSKGAFYNSPVKDVYVTPLTPPSVGGYLFSSNPTIHVYASAVEKYQSSDWAGYGTIVGDLTDEIIDGIEDIKDNKEIQHLNEGIYDLQGRRVNQMGKGIYIVGGKKILMK